MTDVQSTPVASGRMSALCRIFPPSERPSVWIAILVAAVFITQFGSLHQEVINWDESTFILMAASIVDGNLPYVETFDNKPPLMFIMLAGIIAVFGKSLLAIRLFGDACILISSLTIFAIARRKVDTVSAGLGALLAVCFSAAKTGQFTSTELPATTMLTVALWLMIARRDHVWSAAMAGLLISLATLTRSNLGVVAIVFGVYYLWLAISDVKRPAARWSLFAYVLAGLVPPAVVILIYASADALDVLKLAIIDVPIAYMRDHTEGVGGPLVEAFSRLGLGKLPTWLLDAGIALVFLAVARAGIALGKRPSPPRELDREDTLAWLMFGAILYSMLIGGSFFGHYWLQIVPLTGLIFAHLIAPYRQKPVLYGLACGFVAVSFYVALDSTARATIDILTKPGFLENSAELRKAADRIEAVREPDDTFLAADMHLILWYLDAQQVSRAITHPTNILRSSVNQTLAEAGYIAEDELQRIFDSSPTYIITDGSGKIRYSEDNPELKDLVDRNYVVFHKSPAVTVYRLGDVDAIVD